jgi:hypothetical protein
VISTESAITRISQARVPADLFGSDAPAADYRKLARSVHPDIHPGDPDAEAAFRRLSELWAAHGSGGPVLAARGDIANLYRAGAGLLDKMPRDPADSDLIRAEARALRKLPADAPAPARAFYPELIRTARHKDPGTGMTRQVNTITELAGFVTLADVSRVYPGGLDARDAAWMWRRLLFALGGAHRAGLVHGAVLPPHVMILPAQHGLVLADWCYSGPGPDHRLAAVPRAWRDWYPGQALSGKAATSGTDVAMAASVMTGLVGGGMPRSLRAFARGCQLVSGLDAWAALADFDDLIGRLWGPRTFRPFAMPATGTTTAGRAP